MLTRLPALRCVSDRSGEKEEAVRRPRTGWIQGVRLYPLCMAGHIAQGALAAAGVVHGGVTGIALASTWTALYIAYQGLSVLRKEDSPGLDIADYMAGFGLGLAGSVLWKVLA